MPQMGESVAEGTVVRWIKKVGDSVERDEPLFEISTDKVDAEIPSPAAGVLTEIRVQEGETVPVNSIVGVIGSAQAAARPPQSAPAPPASTGTPQAAASSSAQNAPAPAAAARVAPSDARPHDGATASAHGDPTAGPQDRLHLRSSPLVRRIAKEHQVDISQIRGTGISGRVTKRDILQFIGSGQADAAQAPAPSAPRPTQAPAPRLETDRVEKMSVMRKKIAEHMVISRRTSAHVHSVFEVNFTRISEVRQRRKAEFERSGAKLTFLSFILKAAADGLRNMPVINASIDGENVVYHKDVNIGIAVALDWGLIVPVVKRADELDLLGLSRAVSDLADRARSKQLKPDDVAGGTFTVTNPGTFGALFGMPIINQPQVAILGVGNIEKRPVVVDDAIGIRPMAYLTLGYDHRLIDGAIADQYMSAVKKQLENWPV
jgi:2-oxoglutarate dehydrogenase E2 component (dihydrolipoamide succinyltransferase)